MATTYRATCPFDLDKHTLKEGDLLTLSEPLFLPAPGQCGRRARMIHIGDQAHYITPEQEKRILLAVNDGVLRHKPSA